MVQADGEASLPLGAKLARGWYGEAKATKRRGTEDEDSESADSTGEVGEPAPGDPAEGSGRPDYDAS